VIYVIVIRLVLNIFAQKSPSYSLNPNSMVELLCLAPPEGGGIRGQCGVGGGGGGGG